MVSERSREKIHKIVMGVDPEQFTRTTPYDGNGTVIAVGRLLEKKGFTYLIEAAAQLKDTGVLHKLVVVGDGRLREDLVRQQRALDVEDIVELAGAKRQAEVRELLESAALLAMPSVVAPDGDRDSMPVVVKEALAMGVPVVATDEVGLPEVVRSDWGRLVPPGDPAALAEAIAELLAMPPDARAKMGARGREFVLGEYGVEAQTAKLVSLIEAG
jgi:glycosyltransferase involved in cell wall biosynthesis